VFAGMQRVEIGDAIDAKDDSLAIDDELLVAVFQGGLDDGNGGSHPAKYLPRLSGRAE